MVKTPLLPSLDRHPIRRLVFEAARIPRNAGAVAAQISSVLRHECDVEAFQLGYLVFYALERCHVLSSLRGHRFADNIDDPILIALAQIEEQRQG